MFAPEHDGAPSLLIENPVVLRRPVLRPRRERNVGVVGQHRGDAGQPVVEEDITAGIVVVVVALLREFVRC